MPTNFNQAIDKQSVTNALQQINKIDNSNSDIGIRQNKEGISIHTNSQQVGFKGFSTSKHNLEQKTLKEQSDLVRFINDACYDANMKGLSAETTKINARKATGVLSSVLKAYDLASAKELAPEIFDDLNELTKVIAHHETLPITDDRRKRFRYAADPVIAHIPIETAVSLPTSGDEDTHRFHGNFVQLHPKEPPTIVTQCPKPAAQGDFWLAGFKNDAKVIVDLTQPKELEDHKRAHVYYPTTTDNPSTFTSGGENLTVSLLSHDVHPDNPHIKRYKYNVASGDTQKIIYRINFENWVDHEGIDVNELDQLIDAIDDIAGHGLVMVHCSAGVGRSGTCVLARTAKHQLLGIDLTDSILSNKIMAMGKEGRMQRNKAFIQKDTQMLTLVNFLRHIWLWGKCTPVPERQKPAVPPKPNAQKSPTTQDPAIPERQKPAVPERPKPAVPPKPNAQDPAIPKRAKTKQYMSTDEFLANNSKHQDYSHATWRKILIDLQKVNPKDQGITLDKLEAIKEGSKNKLLYMMSDFIVKKS